MNKSTATIVAFVAGVATGAALGILFAPDEGKNTRDKLSFQLDKYRLKLLEVIKNLGTGKEGAFSHAKSEGQQVIAQTRSQAEKLLDEVDTLMSQIKKAQ